MQVQRLRWHSQDDTAGSMASREKRAVGSTIMAADARGARCNCSGASGANAVTANTRESGIISATRFEGNRPLWDCELSERGTGKEMTGPCEQTVFTTNRLQGSQPGRGIPAVPVQSCRKEGHKLRRIKRGRSTKRKVQRHVRAAPAAEVPGVRWCAPLTRRSHCTPSATASRSA